MLSAGERADHSRISGTTGEPPKAMERGTNGIACECQRLGRTVKWPSGRDGRTVEGLYGLSLLIIMAFQRQLLIETIKPRNAGDGRPASTTTEGSGWTEPY